MRIGLIPSLMMSLLAVYGTALPVPQSTRPSEPQVTLDGRWQVKFSMAGLEKNLTVICMPGGVASFVLLDTAPDSKPAGDPLPGTWSQLTNNRVSFSSEVELPIGTCCREKGTLILKGRLGSNNSISGKLIFVTSIDEEESPYKFHTIVGSFTATRVLK